MCVIHGWCFRYDPWCQTRHLGLRLNWANTLMSGGKHESFLTLEWEYLNFSYLFALLSLFTSCNHIVLVTCEKVCRICCYWTFMIKSNNWFLFSPILFGNSERIRLNLCGKVIQEFTVSTAFKYLISVFVRNSKEISSLVAFVGLEFGIILFLCLLKLHFDWQAVALISKNMSLLQ